MITTKELKQLSHICAYCGKVLTMDERTNDHIVPKSAGGKVKISNIVVCCSNCNRIKSSQDINKFLEVRKKTLKHFINYLKLIDYQVGNNNYSNAVINNFSEPLKKEILSKRLVIKTPNKKKTLEEILPKIEDNQTSDIIQKFFKLLKSILFGFLKL